MISAKIIADSLYLGDRLTTFVLTYPRFIHAELMAHRAFSRNASSSRAIPTKKMLSMEIAKPVHWGKLQSGMQARSELQGLNKAFAKTVWHMAGLFAKGAAFLMLKAGLHKQVANRVLEPFTNITVIVTSSEAGFKNFFSQRCHPDAQPEIKALADAMANAYFNNLPNELSEGDSHIPFVTMAEAAEIISLYEDPMPKIIKIAVARCARVSYLTHDGKRDYNKDIALYDKLVSAEPPHLSPLEHVVMAKQVPGENGNLAPVWWQYRKSLEKKKHELDS